MAWSKYGNRRLGGYAMKLQHQELQRQGDLIQRYFRTTTEPYDSLEWDGSNLYVCLDDQIVETYTYTDLVEIIHDF